VSGSSHDGNYHRTPMTDWGWGWWEVFAGAQIPILINDSVQFFTALGYWQVGLPLHE